MKKFFILILLFFCSCARVFALDIVYPKTNPVRINAKSTFFIGSTNPDSLLKINDRKVEVSPIGAFAQIVPLKFGKNYFKLVSGKSVINFTIVRPRRRAVYMSACKLIEYPPVNFYVIKDNTPLRWTPVNRGVNRMSHLPYSTNLLVNGEKGNFYRVCLNSKLSGWVAKSNVKQSQIIPKKTAIKNIRMYENKKFCFYELELDGKKPFVLKEKNGLTLQIFNIEEAEDGTFSLNIPVKKLVGYEAFYSEKNEEKFILKIKKNPIISSKKALEDILIVVDAGHGGSEFGAIGCCGHKEKDINLAIAKNLQKELENRGAKVIMTREKDVQISLSERVKIAKEKEAMLLLSIHANALPDGKDPMKIRGTSVYYYHNQAEKLAENILNSMTEQLKTKNDKVRQSSLALVRPTSSVSVLIEIAYMINPYDYELLLDKNFQINCAKAIADGIEKYILNFSQPT